MEKKIFVEFKDKELSIIYGALARAWTECYESEVEVEREYKEGTVSKLYYESHKEVYEERLRQLAELQDVIIDSKMALERNWKAF